MHPKHTYALLIYYTDPNKTFYLIAAKNLKEIVDSVQEDLIKKLEEIQTEQQNTVTEKPVALHDEHLNCDD